MRAFPVPATDLMEMLCLTLIGSYLGDVNMHWLQIIQRYSGFSVHWRYILLNISSLFLSNPDTSGFDRTLRCRTLPFYMYFQIWLCYSTVWHFQRSQPFTCSFGAFDVNVSVFNVSFSGADVRGLGLVRAAEEADRHCRSIPSRPTVIFSASRSVCDIPGLINEPTV